MPNNTIFSSPIPMSYTQFLQTQSGCHFCKISRNEIIAESAHAFLVPARAPYTENNLLLISKRHVTRYLDLPDEELLDITDMLKKTSSMIYDMGYEDMSFFLRDGLPNTQRTGSGKSVAHLHFHILPGANVSCLAPLNDKTRVFFSEEEMTELTEKLRTYRKS